MGSADGELAAKCLDEYMRGFQERNPQFHVFNAVLHMDEATPHLHIDYIPVAEQKKGMTKQNGMAKALEQMGYGKGKDAISRWRIAERRELEHICRENGIEIAEPKKARGSLSPEEYKAVKDKTTEQAQRELEQIEQKIAKVQADLDKIQELKTQTAENVSNLRSTEISLQSSVNTLQSEEKRLEGSLRALQGHINKLQGNEEQATADIALER